VLQLMADTAMADPGSNLTLSRNEGKMSSPARSLDHANLHGAPS
jgi:hypothetical protein